MKLLIIQTSPYHTASTFLVNALYGLISECYNKKIIGIWNKKFYKYFKNIIIIKNHNTDIDELIARYGKKYKLVFICSERQDRNLLIDPKYKTYSNVTIFDFAELNETIDNPLKDIVDNIYEKIKNILPEDICIQLDKSRCIERINNMNARYEEIKHNDFSFIDPFYEIHGSHRIRLNDS